MNLINGLCAKNGTERPETCKLHLSFQPRFIARYNQLVSLTSQAWESSKEKDDSEGHEEDVDAGEEVEYEEFSGTDENTDELQDYEEEADKDIVQHHVKFQEQTETEDVGSSHENVLSADEEDELYEENEEPFDAIVESTEALVDQDDNVVEAEDFEEHDDGVQYGEEEAQDETVTTTDLTLEQLPESTLHGKLLRLYNSLMCPDTDEAHGSDDDDDLISYEEAVDQAEDGQDYRQQYLNEESKIGQNGDIPSNVPQNDVHITPEPEEIEIRAIEKVDSVDTHMPDTNVSTPKRPLGEITDPSVQSQEPRKRSRLGIN